MIINDIQNDVVKGNAHCLHRSTVRELFTNNRDTNGRFWSVNPKMAPSRTINGPLEEPNEPLQKCIL